MQIAPAFFQEGLLLSCEWSYEKGQWIDALWNRLQKYRKEKSLLNKFLSSVIWSIPGLQGAKHYQEKLISLWYRGSLHTRIFTAHWSLKITALDPLQAGFVCMVVFCQNSYKRGINYIFTTCSSALPYIYVSLFLPNFTICKPWLLIGPDESVQNPPAENSSKFTGISHTESGTENVCDVHSWLYL